MHLLFLNIACKNKSCFNQHINTVIYFTCQLANKQQPIGIGENIITCDLDDIYNVSNEQL